MGGLRGTSRDGHGAVLDLNLVPKVPSRNRRARVLGSESAAVRRDSVLGEQSPEGRDGSFCGLFADRWPYDSAFALVTGLVRTGWPVGRVLSRALSRGPGGDHPSTTTVAGRLQRSTRVLGRAALDVRAPSASADFTAAGGFLILLQVGFAEPFRSPGTLVVSCTTVSPLPRRPGGRHGGLFSVALSRGSPRVAVSHHPALWSPDLPRDRPFRGGHAVARPAHPRWPSYRPLSSATRPCHRSCAVARA